MAVQYSIQLPSLKAAKNNQHVTPVFIDCFLRNVRVLYFRTLSNWPAVYFLETVIFSDDVTSTVSQFSYPMLSLITTPYL